MGVERRETAVRVWLAAIAGLAAFASVGHAQTFGDARRMGRAGLALEADALARDNPAFAAVPGGRDAARVTIPLPIGLVDFAADPPAFDPQDPDFNAFELLELVVNPPLFLELREPPVPRSDVELFVGRNELRIDLGDARAYVPGDDVTFAISSRPLDLGVGFSALRVGVSGFLHEEIRVGLGPELRALLKDAEPARPNTRYAMSGDGIAQAGFALGASVAARAVAPGGAAGRRGADGLYVGAGLRVYFGAGFARARDAQAGLTTGDTIFGASTPLETDVTARIVRSSVTGFGDLGHGLGMDLGAAWISGPLALGLGVRDVGATLTWPNAIEEEVRLDPDSNAVVRTTVAEGVEHETKLPVTAVASGSVRVGPTAVGAEIRRSAGRTSVHLGAEQALGPLRLRGGVARDPRGELQFGAGTGVRWGAASLDVGLQTHSQTISDTRGLRLGASISIYGR